MGGFRDHLIKEIIFPEMSGNATLVSEYSNSNNAPINGQIVRIRALQNFTGSIILYESGTTLNQIFIATATSGTNSYYDNYLFAYPVSQIGVTGSPAQGVPLVSNQQIIFAVSGIASGTAVKVGPVSLFYR
jgi:hypothetical protein